MKKNQRHRNVRLQGLALLLSVVLLFVYMPIAAVAEVIGSLTATEEVPVEEVYEVTALREAGVKHFYVGEGKYTAVSYGEAVHRQDATGTWQEIDNTLTLQNGKYRTPDGRVQLAATNSSDNLLQLTENGYSVGLSFATGGADNTAPYALQSVNTTAATVQNATREAVAEGDSPAVQYEKLSRVLNRSSLQYANLLANTDVRYTLHGNDVTGRITLRGARESYNVALRLQLVGLTPSLDEAGNVILSDATTGTAVYTIPAPGISAPGLVAAYQLLPVSDGLYLLGITTTPVLDDNISTEDFGSLTPGGENTAVTLSFGVVTGTGTISSGGFNACGYISSEYYNADFRDVEELYFENDNIGYVLMGIPTLMPETTFVSAELSVWYSQSPPFSSGDDNVDNGMDYTIVAYKATVPWYSVDTWTYSIAEADYSNFGLAYTPLDTSVGMENDTYVDFDVSDAVEDWYGGESNHGFGFICTDNVNSFYFCNRELAPELTVTYQYTTVDVPDGVYYIKNVMYSGFLNADASETENDIYPTVSSFANDTMYQWEITDLNNGYFEIESVQRPGYVLTAATSVDSSPTIEARSNIYNPNYNQQWRLKNGYYGLTITPRASYYTGTNVFLRCLGVDVGNFLPSRNTKMCSNTDSSNQNEMWLLLPAANALNGQTVEDGFYIIDNLGIDYDEEIPEELVSLYMQSSETGVTAELEIYGTPSPRSRWRLKYLYNGYYNIISAANGRLLSVMDEQENTSERSLVLLNDIGSATQQWKITNVASTGSAPQYKITPRSGEEYETDWCMSAGTGGYYTGDGAAVMQMPYSAERGLWSFSEVELRIINLNVFYDHSYDDKFTNAASRILTMLQETRMYYYDQFGIYINYTKPQLFTSTADSCSDTCDCVHGIHDQCQNVTFSAQYGTLWSPVNQDGEKTYSDQNDLTLMYNHLKSLYDQWDIYGNGNDCFQETFTLIFTGYEQLCYNEKVKNNGEIIGVEHKLAGQKFKGLTLIPTDGLTSLKNPCTSLILSQESLGLEAQVVMHEIGHLFGAEDYGDEEEEIEENDHEQNCTYNYNRTNNLNEMSMCDDCKQIIWSNRNVYQHVFREAGQ